MRSIFNAFMVLWILAYGGIQSTNAAVVVDDFNDGVISSALWSVDSTGSVMLQEAGGVLNVSAPVTGSWDIGWLQSNLILSGDFDVHFDYHWISGLGSLRTRAQLFVFDETENESFQLNFWRGGGVPSGGDMIYSHSNGSTIGHSWTPPGTGKMRIRRQGQNFEGYFWSGGWISLGSLNGFVGDAHFALNANTNGGSILDVSWDNVSITADQISPIPVPSAIWLLGSGLIGLVAYRRNRHLSRS